MLIITSKPHDVYERIRILTHHDATLFRGTGCYMGGEVEMLYSVIGSEEVSKALLNTIEIGNKIEEYDLFHTQIVPKTEIPKFELNHTFSGGYEQYTYIKKFDNTYFKEV